MARKRILLADDHAEFRTVVAQLLEAEFDIIRMVDDGQAAIDETSRLNPDLLLLDITMPVLNGLSAARRLRTDGFAGKIIFLTVHADADYVRAAHAAGAQGYVVKSRIAIDLPLALQEVQAGKLFASPDLLDANIG